MSKGMDGAAQQMISGTGGVDKSYKWSAPKGAWRVGLVRQRPGRNPGRGLLGACSRQEVYSIPASERIEDGGGPGEAEE